MVQLSVVKSFYFIRHGETDWNRRSIYMGLKDIPLNQLGIEQAELAAWKLQKEPIECIATSPLLRAMKTAEIIAAILKKPITVIDDLKECGWGVHEGQQIEEDGVIRQKWLTGEPHEGAEKIQDFAIRVMSGLQKSLELPSPVLIVSHGGVYAALQRIFSWPSLYLENCTSIYHSPPLAPTHSWSICHL